VCPWSGFFFEPTILVNATSADGGRSGRDIWSRRGRSFSAFQSVSRKANLRLAERTKKTEFGPWRRFFFKRGGAAIRAFLAVGRALA